MKQQNVPKSLPKPWPLSWDRPSAMGNPMEASIFLTKAKMDKIHPAGLAEIMSLDKACMWVDSYWSGQELTKKKKKGCRMMSKLRRREFVSDILRTPTTSKNQDACSQSNFLLPRLRFGFP